MKSQKVNYDNNSNILFSKITKKSVNNKLKFYYRFSYDKNKSTISTHLIKQIT